MKRRTSSRTRWPLPRNFATLERSAGDTSLASQMLASTLPGDPIAPRLVEFAEMMEGDAGRHEKEACVLLAEQAEDATGGSLPI